MIGSFGFGEIIFVIVIILILFGPNKIPELARAVGGALGEFKMAQKSAEFDLSGFDQLNRENAETKKKETAALNDKIAKMAKDAGISAEGKTTDELLILISAKMNRSDEKSADGSGSPEKGETLRTAATEKEIEA
jgi:sec-independent protein translocase protein TatA